MMDNGKLSLLTLLYFIQGIPYGFQSRFLPVYLRNLGQSLTSLALYKLLLTPWLCKALWAPLIDKYGDQRRWLLGSITGLALSSLLCAFIDPTYMTLLSVVLFLMNILAATQDISVDRMALELLNTDELGLGNTVQVVGYKLGALFGGGVVLYLVEQTGWSSVFTVISLLYFGTVGFLVTFPNVGSSRSSLREEKREMEYKRCDKEYERSEVEYRKCDKEYKKSQMEYWTILRTVIRSPGTRWMMGYLLIYKLGEQGALSLLPLYLVDEGASLASIAVWTGMAGQAVSIAGSALAGLLISELRTESHVLIRRLFLVQFVPLTVLYLVTTQYITSYAFGTAILSMYGLLLISGLVTTASFTEMMHCSRAAPPSVQATHYSTLATVEIFGKLTFASFSGYLTDVFGYGNMYLLFIGLSAMVPVYLSTRRDEMVRVNVNSREGSK